MKVIGLILFIGALCLTAGPGNAADWVFSQGQSCLVACQSKGKNPVISGTYTKNGNPFYVCRAKKGPQIIGSWSVDFDERAGYNLQPHWSNGCVVGKGGKEYKTPSYDCLCE